MRAKLRNEGGVKEGEGKVNSESEGEWDKVKRHDDEDDAKVTVKATDEEIFFSRR